MNELDKQLKLIFAEIEPIDMTNGGAEDLSGDLGAEDLGGDLGGGEMGAEGFGEEGFGEGGDLGGDMGGDLGGGDFGGGGGLGAEDMGGEMGDMKGEGGAPPTPPVDYENMKIQKGFDLEQIMNDEDETLDFTSHLV